MDPRQDDGGKRRKTLIFGLLIVVAIVCGIGVVIVMARQKPAASPVQGQTYSSTTMHVNGTTYALQVADTDAKKTLGLGQRDNMMPKVGMIFPYDQPSTQLCYWMKDMRFSLDIIWLDAQKQVTMIQPSLSPATYPNSYCPTQPSQYVVELNAGQAHSIGLEPGQKMDFNL